MLIYQDTDFENKNRARLYVFVLNCYLMLHVLSVSTPTPYFCVLTRVTRLSPVPVQQASPFAVIDRSPCASKYCVAYVYIVWVCCKHIAVIRTTLWMRLLWWGETAVSELRPWAFCFIPGWYRCGPVSGLLGGNTLWTCRFCLHFSVEDGHSMFLQNVGIYVQAHKALLLVFEMEISLVPI
jgi:hypothetical protein